MLGKWIPWIVLAGICTFLSSAGSFCVSSDSPGAALFLTLPLSLGCRTQSQLNNARAESEFSEP